MKASWALVFVRIDKHLSRVLLFWRVDLKVISPSRVDSLCCTFQAWPRSVVSSLASRTARVVLKGPGQRKAERRPERGGIVCQFIFYMAVGIFGIMVSRPE